MHSKTLALMVAILALAVFPLLGLPSFYVQLLAIVFILAMLAEGWNIIGGYTGYVSLGQVAFFGVGAYTSAILYRDYAIPAALSPLLGGGIAALIALSIGVPLLRLRGAYFAIVTFAFVLLFIELANSLDWITGGPTGITPIYSGLPSGINSLNAFYWIFLAIMLISILVTMKIQNSKFGYGLIAIRENEEAAPALGVEPPKLKVKAFLISAFLTGLVGGYYSPYLTYINPSIAFDLYLLFGPMIMTIIGGKGTWSGPIMGAFILEPLRQYLILAFSSYLSYVIFGLLLVVSILIMPEGLVTRTRRIRHAPR